MFTSLNLIFSLMVNYPKEIIQNKGRVHEKKEPKYLIDSNNFCPHHHTPTNIIPPARVGLEAGVV